MRIVFMGTPGFAVPSLDILVRNNYTIAGVITAPDKPAGRGLGIQQSEVKKYAVSKKLNLLQPETLKGDKFLAALQNWKPDLQVVVAFRMLPEAVWKLPPLGTVNLHASLLPQYRGAAPINRAIMNGEKETGVTTFFIRHEIDTGKIIFQEKTAIGDNETAGEVHDRLKEIGAELVLKTVKAIEQGSYPLVSQQELIGPEKILVAPKIFKNDCRINWSAEAGEVHNFIRGLSPYPSAFTEFKSADGKMVQVRIFRSEKLLSVHTNPPGKILTDGKNSLMVAVKNGFIRVTELQQAGKKRMDIREFLRGFRFYEQAKAR